MPLAVFEDCRSCHVVFSNIYLQLCSLAHYLKSLEYILEKAFCKILRSPLVHQDRHTFALSSQGNQSEGLFCEWCWWLIYRDSIMSPWLKNETKIHSMCTDKENLYNRGRVMLWHAVEWCCKWCCAWLLKGKVVRSRCFFFKKLKE